MSHVQAVDPPSPRWGCHPPPERHHRTYESTEWLAMDDLTLDRLMAQTLVAEYDWDEEQAEEAVAAWRDNGFGWGLGRRCHRGEHPPSIGR